MQSLFHKQHTQEFVLDTKGDMSKLLPVYCIYSAASLLFENKLRNVTQTNHMKPEGYAIITVFCMTVLPSNHRRRIS